MLFSYFLYKKMPLAGAFRVIFFLPSIVPVVVLTKSFTYVFDSSIGPVDHLLRYVLGFDTPAWFREYPVSQVMIFVYCIWAGLGYNIILLSGAISRLPQEVMEYGRLEGVSDERAVYDRHSAHLADDYHDVFARLYFGVYGHASTAHAYGRRAEYLHDRFVDL